MASLIFALWKRRINRLSLISGPFKALPSAHRCTVTLCSSFSGHVIVGPAVLTLSCEQRRQRCTISARQNKTWQWLSRSFLGEKIHGHVSINNNKRHLLTSQRVTKGFWEGREIHDVISSLAVVLTGHVTLGKLLDLSVPLLPNVGGESESERESERARMNHILLDIPNWYPQMGFVWPIGVLKFSIGYQHLKLLRLHRKV